MCQKLSAKSNSIMSGAFSHSRNSGSGRESEGSQMEPSGVSNQKPQYSLRSQVRWVYFSLVMCCCQLCQVGVSVTSTSPTQKRSPMACPVAPVTCSSSRATCAT